MVALTMTVTPVAVMSQMVRCMRGRMKCVTERWRGACQKDLSCEVLRDIASSSPFKVECISPKWPSPSHFSKDEV